MISKYFLAEVDSNSLRLEKHYAYSYILGLLSIIIISVGAHIVLDRVLSLQSNTAQTMEFAGSQRMLTQRGIQLAYRYILANNEMQSSYFRSKLVETANKLRRANLLLTRGNGYRHFALANDDTYYEKPHELDLKVRTFSAALLEISETPPQYLSLNSRVLQFISDEIGDLLLGSLELSMQRYVDYNQEQLVRQRLWLWGLNIALVLIIIAEGILIFRPAFNQLLGQAQRYHFLSCTDSLTGCHNRRGFDLLANGLHEQVRRYQNDCAVMMIDIDFFKSVNDRYGHHVGDKVIKTVAEKTLACIRKSDILGRLGGEEFAALLPMTGLENALLVAEKLRTSIEKAEVVENQMSTLHFTISIGVSMLDADDNSFHDALNRADNALYQAKESGRNKVCFHTQLMASCLN